MTTKPSTIDEAALAASVAPEDLRCGDFVAVLNEVVEFPSFFWCDWESGDRDEPVRVRCAPAEPGTPWKIKTICLPFVFVKSPMGLYQTIDVRQVHLVRLTKRYAGTVWKTLRKCRKKRHSRRSDR